MLNKIIIMGRLTAAPELKKTQSDLSVCSFMLAVDRSFKREGEERQADFIPCVAWRGTAEFICKYFGKGNLIAVTGSMQSRNYETKDGQKRTAYEVLVEEASFTGEKPQGRIVGADEYIAEQEKESAKPAKRGYDALVDDDDAALPF